MLTSMRHVMASVPMLALVSVMTTTPASSQDGVPFYEDKMNLLQYTDDEGRAHEVRTPEDWAIRRAHILANMQLVMGGMPGDDHRVPLDVEVTDEYNGPRFTRRLITFAVEPDDRVPAYLFIPKGVEARAPDAVRISIGGVPDRARLKAALEKLAAIMNTLHARYQDGVV